MRKWSLIMLGATALFLSSCNFPSALQTETDTDAPPVPATSAETAVPTLAAALPDVEIAGPTRGSDMLWIDNSLLVFVPGGEFVMGKTAESAPADHPEHPEHIVNQSGFWIYRSEVTNAQYAACVAAGDCSPPATNITTDYANPEKGDHPVVGVNWFQGQAYCEWAEGHLPTESQWEKTARGPDGNPYPWGEESPSCDLLNYNNCYGETLPGGTFLSTTSPIRYYFAGASYYEALDLAGNVFEWVQDWYQRDYYLNSPLADPPGPVDGEQRVIRSSGYRSTESLTSIVLRDALKPDEYRDDLGFRCVVEHPTYYAPSCEYTPPPETCDADPSLDITDTSCRRKVGRVDFTVPEGSTVSFSGDSCEETGPNQYSCFGASGGYVNVQVCASCGPSDENSCQPTQCAQGYTQNPETCQCERNDGGPGLLYLPSPFERFTPSLYTVAACPPGRYWDESAEMCVPAENPNNCFAPTLMAVIPVECSQCPRGSSYDEGSGCCQPDKPSAPPVSTRTCKSYTLQLGTCNTTQTGCTNPSQYSNQSSCEAAQCKWVPSAVQAPYCTYP